MKDQAVGIEAVSFYGGGAYIDVHELAEYRGLEMERFHNLLMKEKSIALPYEDSVSFAVNAARPLVQRLTDEQRDSIDMVITCTESGLDFGKSLSTYLQDLLGLGRNCRLFEVKNACYSGTAGFQTAVSFILSQASPGARALVVTTDMAKFDTADGGEALTADWAFAEPSGGAGSIAMLVSDNPEVFRVDVGANGYYGFEIMDTCRPIPDYEAGNTDTSLMAYLDCFSGAFQEYQKRVVDADYRDTFAHLAFHTPFGGMIKGAHRTMMRRTYRAKPDEIEADFTQRVLPGLRLCQRVGNIMGGTVFLSLLSTILHADLTSPQRIGCFSYGSGCCSEFYSGVATAQGQQVLRDSGIVDVLDNRYRLSMAEYEELLKHNAMVKFGMRNVVTDLEVVPAVAEHMRSTGAVVLREIKEFHREYDRA